VPLHIGHGFDPWPLEPPARGPRPDLRQHRIQRTS
jgi:hypothetical protein